MRLWATLARKCFFNTISFWTKDFPTFLDWSTGKLKWFTTMDHYRLSKVSNGQRQEWVKFLPVVEILGRTDPLWKLAECLHNPGAAFAQLALKSKLGDKMLFKGFWLTSALSSSLSPPGDTYIGVGKSFKALAKFFALHTFALVVGPRVCGIFSISLKQMTLNCHQSQYHHCSQNHLAPREVGFTVTPSCVVVFASERGHF